MESCGSGSAEERVARLEEALWVAQAQGGDMDAFALLMSRHGRPLLYYLRRLVANPEDALDLHQEVWLDAFRGLRSLQIPEAFRTWVYRIAHRKVARFRRHEFQQEKLAECFANDPTGNAEEAAEMDLDAKSLHQALGLLPPHQRELLVLGIRNLVALIIILSPLTALVLFLVYFFRYRLEFLKARQQARHQALLEMPHQIASLRKEIEELRARLEKPPGDKTKRDASGSGFTLMELLVTILILGILSALLLPALQGAKARARINTCRNHLRQMGHALMMYESDFRFFPGAGDALIATNNFPWQFPSTNAWTVRILPYLGESRGVFSCPDYEAHLNWNHTIKSDSFGYNAGGSCQVYVDMEKALGLGFGRGRFIRLSDLKSPSDMIEVGDLQAPNSVWLNVISPWHKQPLGSLNSIVPARHAGGANMLFGDSHVEWALQERWIAETASARLRWNNDHEPHPETW